MSTVLIRGGEVVDGTGAPARRADVRVRSGRIAEVGEDLRPDGEPVLDASGALVAPGFFDLHTHLDPVLFWDSACDPLPQHGVTTAVMGNCSLSLAPIRPEAREAVGGVFCYIEDLPVPTFDAAVAWDWESYGEYLEVLARRRYSVDVAGLVGHTALRLYVMGEEAWDRPATAEERAALAAGLEECLRAGAVGLSTSLGFDEDRAGRPVPSRLADDDELAALTDVLAAHDRFLQFIPTVGPTEAMRADVERVQRICTPRGVLHTWIGVFARPGDEDDSAELLADAARAQAGGARGYPQVSPRPLDTRVNWAGGFSFRVLRDAWHPMVQAPAEEKRRMLADPAWRARARTEWDSPLQGGFHRRQPELVRVVSVGRPELEGWLGRTFADIVAERGGHPADVLADWLLDNDLDAGMLNTAVANGDPVRVSSMLTHPAALIGNADTGAHIQMFCAAGDTTLLLTRHVIERGDFTVEEAVYQLTGRPAELFGFRDRGIVEVGRRADLTVFALDELAYERDHFVADLPLGARRLVRPAGGYRATFVAGVPTQHDGALTDDRPGTLLTRA